jgi:hypothetical protein
VVATRKKAATRKGAATRKKAATRKEAATHIGRHREAAGFGIRRVVPRSHNQQKAQDPGAQ